jgi:hypothetical protein
MTREDILIRKTTAASYGEAGWLELCDQLLTVMGEKEAAVSKLLDFETKLKTLGFGSLDDLVNEYNRYRQRTQLAKSAIQNILLLEEEENGYTTEEEGVGDTGSQQDSVSE